jgi:hypothetical protein
MKDFFDTWLLAASFDFDSRRLAAAVRATFDHRQTAVDFEPVAFSDHFARDPSKAAQWRAFARRSLLTDAPTEFAEVVRRVRDFLQPVATAIVKDRPWAGHWRPGGPW